MRIDWQRFKPTYWFQNERTDWEWDDMLNDLLDRYEPFVDGLTVHLGPIEVWTGNWPYSYGNAYRPHDVGLLPSVATRKRLRAMIEKENPLDKVRATIEAYRPTAPSTTDSAAPRG